MKKILVFETLPIISGGQKMTLCVVDTLIEEYSFLFLLPEAGELSAALEARGIPYVLYGDAELPKGKKKLSSAFTYLKMSRRAVKKAREVIGEYRPELLYCPGPAALPWGALCGKRCKIPVIWHLHHLFTDAPTLKLLNICARFKAVKSIISVSDCVAAQIKGKTRSKTVTLYNPVDYEKYSSGSSERVRAELEKSGVKLAGKAPVTGHIALLQPSKRQDTVIEAAKLLKDGGADPLAIFAGACRDEAYKTELEAKIKADGLTENVILLGNRNDVPDLLKLLDVLIIPSIEGYSLAWLEACAAGVPTVCADIGGSRELADKSGAGVLFEYGNPASAAEAVKKAAAAKETLRARGIKFAKEHGGARYARAVYEVFETVGKYDD